MNETAAGDRRQPAPGELLLQVGILIQTLPGTGGRVIQIPHDAVFVFDAISESGVGPGSLGVIALVFKSHAIDVIVLVRWKVELAVERTHAGRVAVHIQVCVAVKIVEASEAVLPARRRGHREFRAAQQAVELGPFAGIGLQGLGHAVYIDQRVVAVEAPFAGNAGVTVGVTHVNTQRHFVVEHCAKVRTLERVGIGVIDS